MVSLVNQLTSAVKVDIPQTGGGKPQTLQQLTFASFMDQCIGNELNKTANGFGVQNKGASDQGFPQMLSLLEQYVAKVSRFINGNEESGQPAKTEDGVQKSSVSDLMAQLFNIMQMMMNHIKPGPGEWVVELPGNSPLQKLVMDANMTNGEGTHLFNELGQQDGHVDLNIIISALKNHFAAARDEQPITAAEPSMPVLETLLMQFGAPSEKVNDITQKAVIGNGEIDLARFFAGLEGLGETGVGADTVKLSGWEVQELKDLLGYAGVAPGQINLLFLEDTMGQPVLFTFERLKGMLKSGIDDVIAGRTVPDVTMVLNDLRSLFKEAVFEEHSIGWSPLVQEAINKVRAALAEAAGHVPTIDAYSQDEKIMGKTLQDEEQVFPETRIDTATKAVFDLDGRSYSIEQGGQGTNGIDIRSGENAVLALSSIAPANPVMAEMPYDQIVRGVVKALDHQESSFKLALFPPELGNVEVNIGSSTKGQVTIVMVADNIKLGAIIEAGAVRFKESLGQQGLVLQNLSVTVDQNPALAMVQNKVGSISSVPAAVSSPDIVPETQSELNPEDQGNSEGENSQTSEEALFKVGVGEAKKSGDGPLSSIVTSLSDTSPDDQDFFENFVSFSFSDSGTAGNDLSQESFQTVGLNNAASDAGPIFNPTPAGSGRSAQAAMVYGQIFDGVLKGLKNREHVLNLKIFPPELGEVKVRLSVKDLYVKVAFTMENSAVRAILEENVVQFKNNLEQNGFILEHFSASVGHQSDPRDNRPRFFMTQSNTLSLEKQENVAPIEEYGNTFYTNRPGNTIHLVV